MPIETNMFPKRKNFFRFASRTKNDYKKASIKLGIPERSEDMPRKFIDAFLMILGLSGKGSGVLTTQPLDHLVSFTVRRQIEKIQ